MTIKRPETRWESYTQREWSTDSRSYTADESAGKRREQAHQEAENARLTLLQAICQAPSHSPVDQAQNQ